MHRLGVISLLALALASCQTQTMERNATGMWTGTETKEEERKREREPEKPPEPPKGTIVTIPPDVNAAFENYVNRPATILADAVEMDFSRNQWLALMSLAVAPDAVSRTDNQDPTRGVLTITLMRKPGVAATLDSVPTVRFGSGLRITGIDRVVLRFWTQQSVERPIWSNGMGAGKKAIYQIEPATPGAPPQEWRGTFVRVTSEIHKVDGEYRFDSAVETKP